MSFQSVWETQTMLFGLGDSEVACPNHSQNHAQEEVKRAVLFGYLLSSLLIQLPRLSAPVNLLSKCP